ncbi:hypothetical protein PCANC_20620 [Puccinia coronata f. sp. avenae]|uniref:Uncharacterized protein n=1 Tax=Puccinia coronata f. sp. avenae TaxID=200324 RepID=A0A2N5SIY4_9BASI|nr:hypothetical protein PCANC_20620 [Puccinia coronata f. sp. avenae]
MFSKSPTPTANLFAAMPVLGVQSPARPPPHAARHVHAYNGRAHGEQACRACTPVWKACKACTPFGQVCRLCTPVGSRKPLESRGLREPTGVQSLHACPKGVQALHALQTGVQALHACLARLHAFSPCARPL